MLIASDTILGSDVLVTCGCGVDRATKLADF